MKTFAQFIAEGRDAPLYHGTDLHAGKSILFFDCIRAETNHRGHSKPGVSLSRSYKTSFKFPSIHYPIVFEVNQSVLIHNKRVSPLNIHHVWNNKNNQHAKFEELFEEFVEGPIQPLTRYLSKLIVDEVTLRYLIAMDPEFDTILSHPLLYDMSTKKWVNK